MKVVMAEKPDAAKKIAAVIGATKRQDGYFEGNGYQVTWAVGHLIELAAMDEYDEKYKKWNLQDLPFIPEPFKLKVSYGKGKQFNIIKRLFSSASEVSNGCDPGREGELIFDLIYKYTIN